MRRVLAMLKKIARLRGYGARRLWSEEICFSEIGKIHTNKALNETNYYRKEAPKMSKTDHRAVSFVKAIRKASALRS